MYRNESFQGLHHGLSFLITHLHDLWFVRFRCDHMLSAAQRLIGKLSCMCVGVREKPVRRGDITSRQRDHSSDVRYVILKFFFFFLVF